MKPLSSRLKIALLSTGIPAVVLLAFGAVMWFVVYEMRIEAVDREIRSLASRHPGVFANRGNYERLASSLEFTFGEDYTNHFLLWIKDAGGRTAYRSPHWPANLDLEKFDIQLDQDSTTPGTAARGTNAEVKPPDVERGAAGRGWGGRGLGMGRGGPPPAVIFTKSARFFTARTAQSVWRFGVLGSEDATLVIGLNHDEVQSELDRVRRSFLLTLPVALLFIGLGGWVVAGRALRPLKTIAETAESVTARGWCGSRAASSAMP
jgi:two-component system, OmpR family, heavy metal sensor histidine kinase CusS